MSKERLELIKGKVEQLVIDVDNEGNGEANLLAVVNDMNYLIGRVQELEESNKRNYWIGTEFKFKNAELGQQNKRYREAIKKAISKCRWNNAETANILLEALEGEE